MANTTQPNDLQKDCRDGRRELIRIMSTLIEEYPTGYEFFGFIKQSIEFIDKRDYPQAYDRLCEIHMLDLPGDISKKLEFVKCCLEEMQKDHKVQQFKRGV